MFELTFSEGQSGGTSRDSSGAQGDDKRDALNYVESSHVLNVKVKVKLVLEQGTTTQRGSRGIALLFPYPRRQIGVGDQSHAPAALTPVTGPGIHCIGGRKGPRADLDGYGKSRHPPGFEPRTVQLYRLSYPGQSSHTLHQQIQHTYLLHGAESFLRR